MRKFFIPESKLNYHDLNILSEYEIELIANRFIEDCFNNQFESVLIITGKGFNSPKGPVIKPIIKKILKKHNLVRKYKSAGLENGGEGAYEVWLKNETG